MSVTFVIGRAGSGKTHRCFTRVVEALRAEPLGTPIYWILPRQATFEAERRLTCDSGLPGFCRARVVVGFSQFGKEILGEAGGSDVPEITSIGRQMILGHLLRQHSTELRFFKSAERQAGLAAELDATFDEMERCGKTAADLTLLLDDMAHCGPLDVEGQTLLSKLADVRLLYDSYNAFLGQDRLDPHRRLQQVAEAIKTSSFVRGATIYVDGFYEFTDHERKMLGAMAAAGATMEITLAMDTASPLLKNHHLNAHEMSLFHRTETTYRLLRALLESEHVTVNEPLLLRETFRYAGRSPALATLEREMFVDPALEAAGRSKKKKPPIARVSAGGAIVRIEAPDRAAEVDAAAREIRSLLNQGYRLRDIAVLMRGLENYRTLIAASFVEHGIEYFLDHRRSAGHHPLICFLRAALHAARFDWNHDSVVALMKTGMAGLTHGEADELENFILLHRVRARQWESPQPWAWRRDLLRAENETATVNPADDPLRIEALRQKISQGLSPLVKLLRTGKPLAIADVATEIFEMFERFGVRSTLARWMADGAKAASDARDAGNLIAQSDEHQQVWENLCELFEQLVDLLGDQQVTPGDFVDIVESGLDRFDLAITPPTVDQVLIGPADRTRCPPVKAVFVLGLNEGEFPAAPHDQTVLSDRERRAMSRRKLDLDPDGQRRLLDERLLGYITMTQPSERLILSRPMGDDAGRAAAPSFFWDRIAALFPDVTTYRVAREGSSRVEEIATPRQLVAGLMRWVRNLPSAVSSATSTEAALAADAEERTLANRPSPQLSPLTIGEREQENSWQALYQWFIGEGKNYPAVKHLRDRAWASLRYENKADGKSLTPDVLHKLFPQPLVLGAGQLETMAACPFKHFVRYGLHLSSRQKADVSGADLGQIYHRLLDKLVGAAIRQTSDNDAPPFAITADAIHQAAAEIAIALRGELMLSSARNRYLLQRVERTLADVIAAQQALMKRSRYRPALAGVSFGNDKSTIPALSIKTPGGTEMLLQGRIDRVDAKTESGEAIVIDYRLGSNTLSWQEIFHGLSLQLLACMLALESGGAEFLGPAVTPTAGFYLRLLRSLEDVAHPDDALDPTDERYLLAEKPRGVFDLNALADLDTELQEGKSLVVNAYLKKGGILGYTSTTDAAPSADFRAILELARRKMGLIGEQIIKGDIAIAPYRLARQTPCPTCEYRGVCRFETSVNRYRHLDFPGREQILEISRQEAGQ